MYTVINMKDPFYYICIDRCVTNCVAILLKIISII